MSTLDWGSSSAPTFENGVDRGMFYPIGEPGIVWNGLTSVNENDSGANGVIRYYDGKKYLSQITLGEFSAVVECYTYPPLLDAYEHINAGLSAGSREGNTYFNFSYRTSTDKGYKIHLVYNAIAQPSSKSYSTISGSTDAMKFSWDISTVPVEVPGARESAHFIVDSTVVYPWVLQAIEDLMYGSSSGGSRFPTIDELIAVFEEGSILRITDHGDGTWTADGPDDVITMLNPTTFEITWPSAVYLDEDTYKISSL